MSPDLAPELDRIAVVLAAGQGKRMRSALPKVLHEVAGRPMLARVLATARLSGCDRLLVVVGHRAESVRAAFPENDLSWVEQREQRGTGHALLQAAPHATDRPALLLVLSGDVPLVRAATLDRLAKAAATGWGAMAAATLRGARHARPRADAPRRDARAHRRGGRRHSGGARDLPRQRRPLRSPRAGDLRLPEPRSSRTTRKGELYLTDALGNAAGGRSPDRSHRRSTTPTKRSGVNDRADLARVARSCSSSARRASSSAAA